jgi:DNA-binding transcriptional regulator YdaS (Cro superfamily)
MEHPVDLAAKVYGSQQAMAVALGVTKAAVWQWKDGGRQVPVQHCVSIERDTNGVVTRKDLRPDDWHLIWPELIGKKAAKKSAVSG